MIHEDTHTKEMIQEIMAREPGMTKAGTVKEAVTILHALTHSDRRPDIAADSLYRVQKTLLQKANEKNLNSDSCFMLEKFLKYFFESKLSYRSWKVQVDELLQSYVESQHGTLNDFINQWDWFDSCWIYQIMNEPDVLYFNVFFPQMLCRLHMMSSFKSVGLQLAAAEIMESFQFRKTSMVVLSGMLDLIPSEMRSEVIEIGDMHQRALDFKENNNDESEKECARLQRKRDELKAILSKDRKKVFISEWDEKHFEKLILDKTLRGGM